MNNGLKVSKPGHSVSDPDRPPTKTDHSNNTVKEMVSALSLAFILGAEAQVGRYREAYDKTHTNAQAGTLFCLHEALTLLEDLDTLSWYAQKCGETHQLNKTIRDMRNHARHDLRENIDHISNDGRTKRTKKLGVHQNLLVSIGFSEEAIKMGSTVLTLEEVSEYIKWATNILSGVMAEGIKAGRISGATVA